MASRPFPEPKNPSRSDILDTVGDPGMGQWRNPVHLKAVHGGWPKNPTNENERADKKIFGAEMEPSAKRGRLE